MNYNINPNVVSMNVCSRRPTSRPLTTQEKAEAQFPHSVVFVNAQAAAAATHFASIDAMANRDGSSEDETAAAKQVMVMKEAVKIANANLTAAKAMAPNTSNRMIMLKQAQKELQFWYGNCKALKAAFIKKYSINGKAPSTKEREAINALRASSEKGVIGAKRQRVSKNVEDDSSPVKRAKTANRGESTLTAIPLSARELETIEEEYAAQQQEIARQQQAARQTLLSEARTIAESTLCEETLEISRSGFYTEAQISALEYLRVLDMAVEAVKCNLTAASSNSEVQHWETEIRYWEKQYKLQMKRIVNEDPRLAVVVTLICM